MNQALLKASLKKAYVSGQREVFLEGDFVKEQIDQVAVEKAESIDDGLANPECDATIFVANHRELVGENVIPFQFKPLRVGRKSVRTLTRWNGYVESIDDTHFIAVVYDVALKSKMREEARIPRKILDDNERVHLKVGAQLQLIVGLADVVAGNRIKETIVYFRRYEESRPSIADDLLPLLARLRDESE